MTSRTTSAYFTDHPPQGPTEAVLRPYLQHRPALQPLQPLQPLQTLQPLQPLPSVLNN